MSGTGIASRFDRTWRLFATGFAFAAMFLGAVPLALIVIPVATLLSRDPVRRRRAQAMVRGAFRGYLWMLRALRVIRLEVAGAERLAACRGRLVIANHPTLLDVVILMALVPNAQCVVKHQLFRHPLMRHIVRAAGYLPNDLAPEEMIARCVASLTSGDNLIIFPEGTRSPSGGLLPLQRGFAHVSTLAGCEIQPVRIGCEPPMLLRGDSWHRIPPVMPIFRVEVAPAVAVGPFLAGVERPLAARRLVSHFERWYADQP